MATVLVVDDAAGFRLIVSAIVKRMGFVAVEAANGAEAFHALEEQEFDLVICDLVMPVMDGIDLRREMNDDTRFKSIPFILVSASLTPENQASAKAYGVDACLPKSFKPAELQAIIKKVMKTASA